MKTSGKSQKIWAGCICSEKLQKNIDSTKGGNVESLWLTTILWDESSVRVPKFSLPVIIAGLALTFLLAGSLSAKERGWHVHGSLSYWNDMNQWENESYFASYLPGFSTTGWRRDGSAVQTSASIGYNFNKNWGIEVFAGGVPGLIIPGTHWLIPPIESDGEPVSASWAVSKEDDGFTGISVIYDYYLSEQVSVFLKVGAGWSGSRKKLENTLTGSHRELLDEQIPYRGGGGSLSTSVYAVGMRMPLLHYTRFSITIAYQFVRKSVRDHNKREWDEDATPPQWTTPWVTARASNFEIGIQLSL